jgi:hypothetical protein
VGRAGRRCGVAPRTGINHGRFDHASRLRRPVL